MDALNGIIGLPVTIIPSLPPLQATAEVRPVLGRFGPTTVR
jgi:hypothetical protein